MRKLPLPLLFCRMLAEELIVSACRAFGLARQKRQLGGGVAKKRASTAKSTTRHGAQPARTVAMRNVMIVRKTSLLQPAQHNKTSAADIDARPQSTHDMRDSQIQPTTHDLATRDGGSVARIGGR
jgi:hypothetical protein